MRLYSIPWSTNVERITLALGHKALPVEIITIDPADRSPVREMSGQDLVPVLVDDDGTVVHDSPAILEHLERTRPEPALWPADPTRRAEADVFVEWFNGVWKSPPNAIEAETKTSDPDEARIARMGDWLTAALDRFEALLSDRDHLLGDAFSVADVVAFPFLKYALLRDPEDDEPFHLILERWMPLGENHPRLAEWIRRVDERPRAGGER